MSGPHPVRLVLHVGLHKSGTTTFQHAMKATYGSPVDGTWFPLMDTPGFGHELIAWTAWGSFDEVVRRLAGGGPVPRVAPVHLSELLARAAVRGVDTLVISAEDLDQMDERIAARLRDEIGTSPTTVLLTITPPVHRWYSAWQEGIKHGGTERPLEAERQTAVRSLTVPGAVRRLVDVVPHDQLIVRVVRTSPPESDLVASLLDVCGLAPRTPVDASTPTNVGLRADIELLRRLNALGVTARVAHRRLADFEVFRAAVRRIPRADGPRPGFGLPEWFAESASAEAQLLGELGERDRVTVLDPHGLLDRWTDLEPPAWIREIETSDWPEVPDADPIPGR